MSADFFARLRSNFDEMRVRLVAQLDVTADLRCRLRNCSGEVAGLRSRTRLLEAQLQTQTHYNATLRKRHEADRREIERVEGERDILERALVRIRDLRAVGVEQHVAAAALTVALEGGSDV